MLSSKTLKTIEKTLIAITFFALPLVFFPQFNNVFASPKLIFVTGAILLLVFIKTLRLFFTKKVTIGTSNLDNSLYLLLVTYFLSVVIAAPNKVAALFDPVRGAVLVTCLILLTLFSHKEKELVFFSQALSILVLFILQTLSYLNFFNLLPQSLDFMETRTFSPTSSILESTLFAFFYCLTTLALFRNQKKETTSEAEIQKNLVLQSTFVVSLVYLVFLGYILIREVKPVFLPFNAAWPVAVEGLKNGQNALFGVGPGNYSAIFTVGKPASYNYNETFWFTNMEYSRSAFLQLFSEIGILGCIALTLIFFQLYQKAKQKKLLLPLYGLIVWGIFMPYNLTFMIIFFTLIIFLNEEKKQREIDLADLDIVRYGIVTVSILFVGTAGFFLYRNFYADYLLGISYIAANNNQIQNAYELQRQATIENPWNESAHLNFAQTNIFLANSLAQKKKLTDTDKQNIAVLLKQGIDEGKQLVQLNTQKASYWANLAEIYKTVIGMADGADVWTISAYMRAIALDKNNPIYYFNLGSVYYSLGNYQEAAKFFEEALSLKQNMPNYSYNLAWSYAKNNNYSLAVSAMETTLNYVAKNSSDYKKATKELAEFKTHLTETNNNQQTTDNKQQPVLTQPSPIPSLSPAIKLPKDSAPPTGTITPTVTVSPTTEPKEK